MYKEARLEIRLPRDLHADFKAAAKRIGKSKSALVRAAIERYLAEAQKTETPVNN